MKTLFTFFKTINLNEEVMCTEPAPSVSIPCWPRFSVICSKTIWPTHIWSTEFLANHGHSCFSETAGAWWVQWQALDPEIRGL